MAIGADSTIEFWGTEDEVTTTGSPGPASIANDGFSTAADIVTWTNDDDAPWVYFLLKVAYGTGPTIGSSIVLHAQQKNLQSSSPSIDNPVPDSNFGGGAIGSFPVDNVTAAQYCPVQLIRLPNYKTSAEWDFFLENKTGQAVSADWQLWAKPATWGPHP